ncbi:MAG: RNA polymerase sigma-70 factor [Mucilaginibacter sp.]
MQAIINKSFDLTVIKDEQVFRDLYKKYFVKLYRFSAAIIKANEPAEEIVHDVLMKLWKKRNSFAEIDNLDTYLYVSVKNLSLNYLRDERKHETADIEELYNTTNYIAIDPESIMISGEKLNQLNNCINELPSRCKLIFKLIKEDGLKYKDTARLLNISVKTVENQLSIALKKIASAISE